MGEVVVSMAMVFIVATLAFLAGGLIGAYISRTMFPPEQQKQLEQSLRNARAELQKYQNDVTVHFAETADLINKLTESYKEVHDHLATGAMQLTNIDIGRDILKAGSSNLGLDSQGAVDDSLQAPKDWAPKVPGNKGTLSEDYGLRDDEEVEDGEHEALSNTLPPNTRIP